MFKVKTTLTVTTDELEIFCDPPLTFEAVGNIGPALWDKLRAWSQEKYPPEQAVKFVPDLFLSVSQNGTAYPLSDPAAVEEFRQAVGDAFLCDLVENYWNYEFDYFKKKRRDSANSEPAPPITSKNDSTP